MKKTEQDWVFAGYQALMESGVGAVRIEGLAKVMQVTKGSFYHHFSNRNALLEAMRVSWALQATTAIMERVEAVNGSPAEKLRHLLQAIFTSTSFDELEASMRNWGAIDEKTAQVLQKMDETQIRYVEDLLKGAGLTSRKAKIRAQTFFRVVVGDFATRGDLGPLAEDAVQDFGNLLLQTASSVPALLDDKSFVLTAKGKTLLENPQLEVVNAAEVRPLRAAILRPMQPYVSSAYPQDSHVDAFHVALRLQRRWLGSASAYPERMSPELQLLAVQRGLLLGEEAWRMRGVAVDSEYRGAGFGRFLVEKLEKELEERVERGVSYYFWANARTSALPFYLAIGYRPVGDVFDLPDIGPHQVILRSFNSAAK
ncbi:MAG: GNAT family N-acetyltransferase [Deltaproteobacteria bacterium]|nr:GNAT family N-acetyltransferase [Deltaproteobacteria bacterium]